MPCVLAGAALARKLLKTPALAYIGTEPNPEEYCMTYGTIISCYIEI
jgi:hypothetical protein